MAASVNNIAATFSATRFPPPSTAAIPSSTAALPTASSARPIAASWNPHSALPRSNRSSLLSLYGFPGPLRPPLLPPLRRSPPSISVGDRLPDAVLSFVDGRNSIRSVSLSGLTRGRKSVIMAVSAAFAPPPWSGGAAAMVSQAAKMRERGVAVTAVVAANDVYVMRAWGEKLGAAEAGVSMLSDGDAELARAVGMAVDLRGGVEGFGIRSESYCLVSVDGVVKALFLNDESGLDEVIRVL